MQSHRADLAPEKGQPAKRLMPRKLRALELGLRALPPPDPVEVKALAAVPSRVLLVKAASLGDGVLIRSLAHHLLSRNPDITIGILGCPPLLPALDGDSSFRIHRFDPHRDGISTMLKTIYEIRACGYEAAVDFEHWSLTSALFLRCSGIKNRIGFSPIGENPRARFLTHVVQLDESESVWDSFARLVRIVDSGLPSGLSTVPLLRSEAEEAWISAWWESQIGRRRGRVLALQLGTGARGDYKRWPIARFACLAEAIRAQSKDEMTVLLTGTTLEVPLMRSFAAEFSGKVVFGDSLGTIQRTALILQRCDLLVSNDTGVMHLGAAMGTPTVGLFGPTNPKLWAPIGDRATYVYSTQIPCSPCVKNYRGVNPKLCTNTETGRCMLDISVDAVLAASMKVIVGDWL